MSRIRVPLAVDAQVRIPIGPVQLPARALVLALIGSGPALLCLALPVGITTRLGIGLGVLTTLTALAFPTREGIWIATFWGYRAVARSLPTNVHQGVWQRARVTCAEHGVVSTVRERTRRPVALIGRFTAPPEMGAIDDGLFAVTPGGWRAVLNIDGPPSAMDSLHYDTWCDGVVAWIRSLDCPAQLLTDVGHLDRRSAEDAFERSCHFGAEAGPLVLEERGFAGDLAAMTLAFRHWVVLAPRLTDTAGKPHSVLHGPAFGGNTASRLDAERALIHAAGNAHGAGVVATPTAASDIKKLLDAGLLGARNAATDGRSLWMGEDFALVVVVVRLGPDADHGMIVKALQRAEVRGTVSLHVLPASRATMRKLLSRRRAWLRYALRAGNTDVDLEMALHDTETLQATMAAGDTGACRIALTVMVRERTRSKCHETTERLRAMLTGYGCGVEVATVPGLFPALSMAPGMPPLHRAVLVTTDAAVSRLLPALGTPFSNTGEPAVGWNIRTGGSAYLSVWERPNFNAVIVGSSGSGKSVWCKTMAIRHVMQGSNLVVLDPDSEYADPIRLVGGRYIELVEEALNPLALGQEQPLGEAVDSMVSVLSVMAGDDVDFKDGRPVRRLPPEDKAWLHRELLDMLTGRTASSQATLSDLIGFVRTYGPAREGLSPEQRARADRLVMRLTRYTQGRLGRIFDRPSTIALEPGVPTAFGFKALSMAHAQELTPALAVVLSLVTDAVLTKRERLIVLVEEAHILTADPDAGTMLGQLVRRARKHRAGVWMASQSIEDFTLTDLGKTLASTAATKVVLGTEDTVADRVRDIFGLAADEIAVLTPPRTGRALLISGEERALVQVTPSPLLMEFIRTDEGATEDVA